VPWNTLTHPHWQLIRIKSVWLFVYCTSHTYRNYCENNKRYTYIPVSLQVKNKRNEDVKLMAFNRSTYIQWNRLYSLCSYLDFTLLFYIPCQFIDKFFFQVLK
jgi:coproporphyrinogen III oxidase-like Fe-S oxidoreductase